jgi:hypothetical protein
MQHRRHPSARNDLPEEVEQRTQLERRGHDAEDQSRAQISARLSLILFDRLRRMIHDLCYQFVGAASSAADVAIRQG